MEMRESPSTSFLSSTAAYMVSGFFTFGFMARLHPSSQFTAQRLQLLPDRTGIVAVPIHRPSVSVYCGFLVQCLACRARMAMTIEEIMDADPDHPAPLFRQQWLHAFSPPSPVFFSAFPFFRILGTLSLSLFYRILGTTTRGQGKKSTENTYSRYFFGGDVFHDIQLLMLINR
jgi:hypothetical protein